MAFIRIRRGRYVYREVRWREGKKIRSRSDYLGKLNDWLHANFTPEPGAYVTEKWERQKEKQEAHDRKITDKAVAEIEAKEKAASEKETAKPA